jgi:Na+-driven multidrug efflux pump
VGALACLSPLTTVATILVLTRLVAGHGGDALAGYGIGVRLEFLLIPVAFGVGVASVPMVGMAMGAGDVARARAVAWRAAGLSALLLGAVGLLVSLAPQAWSGWFSRDAQVLAQADSYLRLAGPGFAFFGAGLTLYFASQGAGKVAAPVAAALLRFVLVLAGGWLVARWSLGPAAIHGLVGLAMVAYGAATVLGVRWVSWGPAAQRPVSLAAS